MKGGNTDGIYNEGDNREEFARSLERKHPDVVKTIWRYRRWHHSINFNSFKDIDLIRKSSYIAEKVINNYGMYLK